MEQWIGNDRGYRTNVEVMFCQIGLRVGNGIKLAESACVATNSIVISRLTSLTPEAMFHEAAATTAKCLNIKSRLQQKIRKDCIVKGDVENNQPPKCLEQSLS